MEGKLFVSSQSAASSTTDTRANTSQNGSNPKAAHNAGGKGDCPLRGSGNRRVFLEGTSARKGGSLSLVGSADKVVSSCIADGSRSRCTGVNLHSGTAQTTVFRLWKLFVAGVEVPVGLVESIDKFHQQHCRSSAVSVVCYSIARINYEETDFRTECKDFVGVCR